jgi:hypothetical protein
MADVVVLNDPVTSQGANNAIKSAASYLEAIDGHVGPLDCWDDVASPREHLDRLHTALAEHFPDEAARWTDETALVDDQAWLHGRFRPVVR